ncbi:hypothetical protein DITRI_Ditri09bG0093600 [Diplodiscus trichospermus]
MQKKWVPEPSLLGRLLVPIELENEILSKLPVKSLLRFKCVQKSWRNLIEDPSFVTMHTILLGKTTNGFLLSDFSPTPYYIGKKRTNTVLSGSKEILVSSGKWLLREAHRYIVGSSEGLVCLVNRPGGLKIHIWNPSTRKIMQLPSFVCEEVIAALPFVFGFGFCPKLKDYKVVIISYPFHNLTKVYSLNTNSWHKIANPRLDLSLGLRRGKFFNGASLWLGKQIDSPRRRMIVAFKFEEEVFVEINLPNHHNFEDENVADVYIAEYQNLLSLITYRHDENMVDLWVRKEDGVAEYSWVKQLSIQVPIPKHKLYRQKMMNFEKNGELLLVLNRKGKLVLYNTKTNQIEKVQKLGDEVWQLISCKQSLVSLPGEISEF